MIKVKNNFEVSDDKGEKLFGVSDDKGEKRFGVSDDKGEKSQNFSEDKSGMYCSQSLATFQCLVTVANLWLLFNVWVQ